MDHILKIISLFLICNLAFARFQVPFSFTKSTATAPSANITCYHSTNVAFSENSICLIGTYTTTSVTMYDGAGGGPYVMAYMYKYYCPSLSSYSSWTTGNTLSWTYPDGAANNRYISTTTSPSAVIPTSTSGFQMWHIRASDLFYTNKTTGSQVSVSGTCVIGI